MLIGALLVLTWVILLVRYPAKALPVSLAALAGLGLVAAWVIWQDNDESRHLQRQELRLSYAPERCPVDRPLAVELKNGSDRPLLELRWRIAAYRPGDSVNLADTSFDSPRYRAPN
ncbi:multidrug transporter, partial [Pseudomonas aeruginosa]|nr:multidrug transporter [Pseudomonas aeruginosa]